MWKETHRLFGRIIADRFDLPKEGFIEWTVLPDFRYYKKRSWQNTFLHRFTSHGLDNIDVCIKQGKEIDKVIYDEEYDNYIRCLLISHNYLDVFNWILHPSYPNSREFKFIWAQIPRILTFRTLKDPDIEDILNDMVYNHESIDDLNSTMIKEYKKLSKVTGYMKKILKKY